jgi:hypothetical protein
MRPVIPLVALLAALSCLSAGHAGADEPGRGWQLERDVDSPTYAFIEPAITDLDIDVMVLSCEPTERKSGLQLRLYPPEPGPFRSAQSSPVELAPDVVIDIDGRRYAARLLFADDFVVVANAADGPVPVLSASLVTSLQNGRHFTMRLHAMEASPSSRTTPAFEISADLQAGIGGTAIAVLRRCGTPNDTLASGPARAR